MINMLSKLVDIAPYRYYVSHVNNNVSYSVVTSQLCVEITYLFYDYEITLFRQSLNKINAFTQHFYNHIIDLDDL